MGACGEKRDVSEKHHTSGEVAGLCKLGIFIFPNENGNSRGEEVFAALCWWTEGRIRTPQRGKDKAGNVASFPTRGRSRNVPF